MSSAQEAKMGISSQKVEETLTKRLIQYMSCRADYDCRSKNVHNQIDAIDQFDRVEVSSFINSATKLQKLSDELDTLRSTFFEDTKRDFDSLFLNRPLDIQMIRETVHILLQSIMKARLYGYESSEEYKHLNDSLLSLENALTAAYLGEWLAGDCDNRQTIHGFVMYPYKKENLYSHDVRKEPKEKDLRKMYRKNDTLKIYHALREYQQTLENTPITEKSKDSASSKAGQIDLIALTFLKGYFDGNLQIMDFLFERQYLMSTGQDTQKGKERGLSNACRKYQEFVQKTHDLSTGDDAPVEHNRQYVASSLLLYELEQSYQFHLNGRIAQRICEGDIEQNLYNQDLSTLIRGRYADNDICLFLPKYAQEGFTYENLKPDVLNFDDYIDCMYCKGTGNEPLINTGLHALKRIMAADARILLLTLFPPEKQHTWSDRDFADAANFFRTDYPITNEFLKIAFPEIPEGRISKNHKNCYLFYYYYREIYVNLEKEDNYLLKEGREKWIEITKKSQQSAK